MKAGDGIRTHDNHVGNVVLYQLSYTRDPRGTRPGGRTTASPAIIEGSRGVARSGARPAFAVHWTARRRE